jgi:hypothetical protein
MIARSTAETGRGRYPPPFQLGPERVALKEAGGLLDVLPLTTSELCEVIEGPCRAAGLALEERDGRSLTTVLRAMVTVGQGAKGTATSRPADLGQFPEGSPARQLIEELLKPDKRWRDTKMVLRWTGAAMLEAAKEFRRLKAHKQLPILRAALLAHQAKHSINPDLEQHAKAA